MGGKIFQQGANAISTPRMPRAVYLHMHQHVHSILDGLRDNLLVEDHKTPVSAPEKTKFGDVDVLVLKTAALEDMKMGKPDFRPFLLKLEKVFGAVRKSRSTDEYSASYALPWPEQYKVPELPAEEQAKLPVTLQGLSLEPKFHYVQVDIKVIHSRTLFDYTYMVDSHANPFTFLGASLSDVGLSAGPRGLRLRVQEIRDAAPVHHKKDNKDDKELQRQGPQKKNTTIDLTCNAKEVCEVVGLDYDTLMKPDAFTTYIDYFDTLANSKYFSLKAAEYEVSQNFSESKSAIRKKLEREPYRQWVQEYLPHAINQEEFKHEIPTIDEVKEQMFKRFPHAEAAYNFKLKQFLDKKNDDNMRRIIRDTLGEAGIKDVDNYLCRFAEAGFKHIWLSGNNGYELVEQSQSDKENPYKLKDLPHLTGKDEIDEPAIARYVRENWQLVGNWEMWVASTYVESSFF